MGRSSEAELRAIKKYNKEYKKQIKFTINKRTEPELLAWVEAQENKQGYIKFLIIADMNRKRGANDGKNKCGPDPSKYEI